MTGVADRPLTVESFVISILAVEERERAAIELCIWPSIALEKGSERLKHLAAPSASHAMPSAARAKAVTNPREMALVTPRGCIRRSTFRRDQARRRERYFHVGWLSATVCKNGFPHVPNTFEASRAVMCELQMVRKTRTAVSEARPSTSA